MNGFRKEFERAREAAGLTQRAVAKRVGRSESAVSQMLLENRNLTLRTMERLAEAVGCRVEIRLVVADPDRTCHLPYLQKETSHLEYNPAFDRSALCSCGHPYFRHFDPYEDNVAIGCKYCSCDTFQTE